MSPSECSERARIAALRRHHPDEPATEAAVRAFKTDRLAAHIARVVAEAPALSPEQRDRLAVLLRAPKQAA